MHDVHVEQPVIYQGDCLDILPTHYSCTWKGRKTPWKTPLNSSHATEQNRCTWKGRKTPWNLPWTAAHFALCSL